ncbi:MAG: bifunctional diaminohydroxyphosphoribosylaminopyrimidine deaminase/5-amino-6-(5-phosphoribosylamino)uracil reductase RibD [Candidatus Peregrinibacteria bacterium]
MTPSDFFRHTLSLAINGRGFVSPNPEVGCVIVKNGKIIGEGWHTHYGGAHAEVNAIKNAEENGESVAGSTVFVSLEPCAHTGKTPPCAELLVQKQVKEVFIFFSDPNPLVAGKGIKILQNAEIALTQAPPDLQKKYAFFYEPFQKYITTKTPFVTGKIAKSANGKTGIAGKSIILSGAEAKNFTYGLRQQHDAILVGVNTVLIDNPHLGVRGTSKYTEEYGDNAVFMNSFDKKQYRDPIRIILDPHLKSPFTAHIFRDENFLVVTQEVHKKTAETQWGSNKILTLPVLKDERFDIPSLLKKLGEMGIASVLVEGGSTTLQLFLDAKVLDQLIEYETPEIITHINAISAPKHCGTLWKEISAGKDVIKIWNGFCL